ncbi:MAG: hybrid sensor histidine kinase/response regulator, partial [Flavobacteriaceae bacterium]
MRSGNIHKRLIFAFLTCFLVCSLFTGYTQDDVLESDDIEFYFNQTRLYQNQNKIDLALETLDKAAALAETNKNEKALVDCYHKFARLYMDLNKRETTIFYWDRATVLLNELEYPYGQAVHKFIEAQLLFDSGNNFQAIFMLNEARQLSNDRNLFNNIVLLEGEIYLSIDKYDSAATNFNSLVVNNDVFEKEALKAKAYMGLARLHSELQNYEESIKNGNQVLTIAQENRLETLIYEANEILVASYEALRAYDKALMHSQNILVIKDSVFT